MESSNHSILIVDDSPDILDLYKTFFEEKISPDNELSSSGVIPDSNDDWSETFDDEYQIVLVESAEEAISQVKAETAENRRFPLGFINMEMDNGDGYDVVQQILEIDNDIHCALISGKSNIKISRLAQIFQFQDQFFIMPRSFDFDELFQVSKNLLSNWQLKQTNKAYKNKLKKEAEKNRQITESLITNNHLTKNLSTSYLQTIKAITKAIDAKDPYAYGHSNRVTKYSKYIARELAFTNSELNILEWSCILHDIGKISIPESILNKTDELTIGEYDVIKTHSYRGYEIIKEIPYLKEVLKIILHHHERHDGWGYPHNIQGDEIPICSAIISVSDAFDAMTSDRPYRQCISANKAFNEIIRCTGAQFSPIVVEAFSKAYNKVFRELLL
jgi:putative nucleotidyltransferase with HDIG domain